MSDKLPTESMLDLADDPDTEAYAFHALLESGAEIGGSVASTKSDDLQLLAHHIFQVQSKYDEAGKDVLKEAIGIYNENKERWAASVHAFGEEERR